MPLAVRRTHLPPVIWNRQGDFWKKKKGKAVAGLSLSCSEYSDFMTLAYFLRFRILENVNKVLIRAALGI